MCWFTNLDFTKRHEDLILYKSYDPELYPSYDNFDAIEVSNVADIPVDYDGVMGVTIGFLTKYNPDQFEIVGISQSWFGGASKTYPTQQQISADGTASKVSKLNDAPALRVESPPSDKTYYVVDGESYISLYARIFIKSKRVQR